MKKILKNALTCVLAVSLVAAIVDRAIAQSTSTFDTFGGTISIQGKSTGFFHLEKVEGRHFLITPSGNGYRALGINHFHNMTSRNFDAAVAQIQQWGFNAGCYQGPRWMWKRYPYTKGINLVPVCQWMTDDKFAFKDVFDPAFLTEMEASIRKTVQPQAENKMLIGYFWTDIPLWNRKRKGQGWISYFKGLAKESPGGKKWNAWKLANPDADEKEFITLIARQLYSKGHEFLRKYDGNHLVFGDRYHEVDIPRAILNEAIPYIDAIGIQPTSREFNHDFFERIYRRYNKPFYIADHVSSFPTKDYPVTMGQSAKDGDSYAEYYRRYVTTALSQDYIIGYNKCQYQDQSTPKMLKQGLLKSNEEPYVIVGRVADANLRALELAYSGKVIEKKTPAAGSLQITSPQTGTTFSKGESIVVSAQVEDQNDSAKRVSFFYIDEKWKLIGHDAQAPFEATWKNPPAGDWKIVAAIRDENWKIVEKTTIDVTIE